MLKLICGPSGAGKTQRITQEIRKDLENGIRCFLLVPEQQAYISERDIPALLPKNASLLFEVLNFSGLCEDVFRAYGGGAFQAVSNGARAVLMWDTLQQLQSFLVQYGKNIGADPSFPAIVLQTITELRQSGIDSSKLEAAAESMEENETLKKKLKDLSVIDAYFHQRVEECYGQDPADKLLRLAEKLKEHRYFDGCHVYIDSFTGFTALEYPVLLEILKQADSVTVALCTDSFTSKLPQFAGTVKAARQLEKYAAMANTSISKEILPRNRGAKSLALELLEENIWHFGARIDQEAQAAAREDSSVRFLKCANLYEESEVAAWTVLELIQAGISFGEIAIVARDVETYRGVLDAALDRYHIPYFLSERTDLAAKPLPRLLLSALRAVAFHYRAQDIMTLLKTGLSGVNAKDVALFEEYCDTWHLSGTRFEDALWSMNPDGLTTERSARADEILMSANRTRAHIMAPLQKLNAAMRASKNVKDRCRATYEYLCDINITELLSARAEAELAGNQKREAGETLRLYGILVENLTTLAELLPEREVSTEDFMTLLSLLFAESDMGSIPTTHDCVIIGSASSLRVENIKASLLLGLCEGEFPKAVSEGGLLTELDKLILEGYDIRFDAGMASRSGEELLHVYRAMTKPTKNLFLFTNTHQTDGSDRAQSLAYTRALQILGKASIGAQTVNSRAVKQVLENTAPEDQADRAQLPPAPTGSKLYLSQSKIKTFVNCPYSYYTTYVLKLRDKKDATPSLADDGVFLHFIYENFLRASLGDDGQLHLPADADAEALADRIIQEYLTNIYPVLPEEMDQHLVHLFNRLRGLALMMLCELIAQLRNSNFVPTYFEKSIGSSKAGALPPVEIGLEDGSTVVLSGQIDRVDLYEKEGEIYIMITDYKAGAHDKFSLSQVQSGMDIQLVLYLYALLASDQRIRAAGAQYLFARTKKGITTIERTGFVLDDGEISAALDGSEDRSHLKGLLKQSDAQIRELQREMEITTSAIAKRILAGEAQKTPSEKACKFCPIRNNCDACYHK